MNATDLAEQLEQARAYDPDAHPRAYGDSTGTGLLRSTAADFYVEESLPFELSGKGEHCYVYIEKRGLNTADVVKLLSKAASLHPRNIGFAGMKDRHAVTRQWFSLYLPGMPDPDFSSLPESVRPLEIRRHDRKLRRGAVRRNFFRLVVRELQADRDRLDEKYIAIKQDGFPNYFGPQRFGRGGGNLERAIAVLERGKTRRKSEGIYLSSVRSMLFNRVLAERIQLDNWTTPLPGDVMQIAGTHSLFLAEESDATLLPRHEQFQIGITGPLCGREARIAPEGMPLAIEKSTTDAHGWWVDGLERCRVDADRRMLRAQAHDLEVGVEGETMAISFSLESGSYATSLLRELLDVTDVMTGARGAVQSPDAG